ncbi:mitochondrial import receptor subunit TOM6-like [Quillaja saponaria]|uniref:Mitochondrial import receptor subunit TOM6-like n=1 Tax=Quillaja saponaria TaxID=32244 RepID=A0AAD7PT83_QUISA|nr:mitochondrial import receptor subunit TOM6-like [Quillaja saponaria]
MIKNPIEQRAGIIETMFPGMFMRKPDKAVALKQLKTHVYMFGAWVAVIRVTPYVLHYLIGENEELKLDL